MITALIAAAALALLAPTTTPEPPPVPQDEIDYLEEAFVVHLTGLSNIAEDEIVYVACDAEWVEDHIVAMCFAQLTTGPFGAEIMTTLITHTATAVSLVPTGSYLSDPATVWIDPALTMEVDAPPLPPSP